MIMNNNNYKKKKKKTSKQQKYTKLNINDSQYDHGLF
jgi:hypothetical protein